ncbi:uncharacterized protein N7479_007334 [Penicillium vulpinum]|uniref:Uncharacterized protein n=1 Tax=Penicillium vulpinum TaxID=29845 RepID=A0A1V6S0I0_9EURO|nr:uncharacterized protein N7479_007334 [Penicillium vulpinum]KAJ5960184.1 hypothetical protein N7479_007334 [Penicillium vulpinum]OQE07527.1 hypothetical protein PENVUL_c013G01027 [Penicillium vulpinum]
MTSKRQRADPDEGPSKRPTTTSRLTTSQKEHVDNLIGSYSNRVLKYTRATDRIRAKAEQVKMARRSFDDAHDQHKLQLKYMLQIASDLTECEDAYNAEYAKIINLIDAENSDILKGALRSTLNMVRLPSPEGEARPQSTRPTTTAGLANIPSDHEAAISASTATSMGISQEFVAQLNGAIEDEIYNGLDLEDLYA